MLIPDIIEKGATCKTLTEWLYKKLNVCGTLVKRLF